MEPSDFDKILRGKVQEGSGTHNKEMEAAKPFVWSAISHEVARKRGLTWYHLAAAILLLLVSFSFILYNIQHAHRNELHFLSQKIDQLENNYQKQLEQLKNKNTQLSALNARLDKMDENASEPHPSSQVIKEKVIYRTDTVYIKQVEYVSITSEQSQTENILKTPEPQVSLANMEEQEKNNFDEVIYPSRSPEVSDKKTETIKLKFSAFTARSN